jgi:hypothetical protein
MRNRRIRALVALMTLGAMSIVPFALAGPADAATPGQVVITEWMYNPTLSPPAASEFVEVTNVGGAPVDMTTYSFDDDSRTPGSFSLAALGSLAPGESGLIIETTAAAFRADWGLGASVKIAELNTNNLGRNDEINIFNGTTLADRLTYGDQNITGTIRTQGTSGVPPRARHSAPTRSARGCSRRTGSTARRSRCRATPVHRAPARSAPVGRSRSSAATAAAAPCRASPNRRRARVPPPPTRRRGRVAPR